MAAALLRCASRPAASLAARAPAAAPAAPLRVARPLRRVQHGHAARRGAAGAAPRAGAAAQSPSAPPPFRVDKRPKDHRKCVGIVLLNARNEAFVACRADGALLDKGDDGLAGKSLWQLPQGGVDKGEDVLDAARRELYEETGVRSAELLGELPAWLCYQFPAELLATWRKAGKGWGGKYVGQAQRWFYFRFTGAESEVDLDAHGDPEFCEYRWMPLDDAVVTAVVPFKRHVYAAVVAHGRQLLGLPPLAQ